MTAQEVINTFETILTPDEQQLLKDTIIHGSWGDCDMEFQNENCEVETVSAWGYCTNDAHRGGHFKGRIVSTMFCSIYRKLCPNKGMGQYMAQCHDWWGDGTGDMLFLREDFTDEYYEWAKK